jgi:CubicO group peptidase (beta-lactamase class C family)
VATWRLDPECDPGSVGVDGAALDAVAETFAQAVEAGELFHGAQMAVYRAGKRVLDMGGGTARVRTNVPVTPETMFVIYSSTKGMAALAMLMLYERGKLHFDEPVVKYWPSFDSLVPEKRMVTIRHIMGHRGGFPLGPRWLTARYWPDRDAIRRAMEEVPLRWTPGEKNGYHAMNFGHMVNELIERIDGRDCGRFLAEEVFAPLGVGDFYVGLPDGEALEARVAWSYNRGMDVADATGVVAGGAETPAMAASADLALPRDVRDEYAETPELALPFNRPAIHQAVLPAGGGIATARALARVYAALALGGELDGVRLVKQESLAHATTPTNRAEDVDEVIRFAIRWGTGWHMGMYGRGSTLRTFGHGGAGGQVGFADPDKGLAFAFVCNGGLKPEFLRWRYELQSLVYAACRD